MKRNNSQNKNHSHNNIVNKNNHQRMRTMKKMISHQELKIFLWKMQKVISLSIQMTQLIILY